MSANFPDAIGNEELEGDNASAAASQRQQPMSGPPEQRGGNDLQEQVQIGFGEVDGEHDRRELVRDDSNVQPEVLDGDIEFVMITLDAEWQGKITNNGTLHYRRKSSALWNEWPKLKTVLKEK